MACVPTPPPPPLTLTLTPRARTRARTPPETNAREQIQQSRGWVHYATHRPEPHILLFRRALGTDPVTGEVNPELLAQARLDFERQYGIVN